MKRRKIETYQFPIHINARTVNKEPFPIPLNEVWKIYLKYLENAAKTENLEILAFVLMNNHFHLLVQVPDQNLPEIMKYFMRETSKAINRRAGRINQLYGRPYHYSIIATQLYFTTVYKYIYLNPVRAQICKNAEAYRYSSLHYHAKAKPLAVTLKDPFIQKMSTQNLVEWINAGHSTLAEKEIRKNLKKKFFEPSADSNFDELLAEDNHWLNL